MRWASRRIDRSRRRVRLRTTAVPTRRGTAHATAAVDGRPEPGDESARNVTLSGPRRTRRPRRRTAAWDERPRRWVRRTDGVGPCGAAPRAPLDPPASTCGAESHGAWPASGCSAGTCASLTSSSTGDSRALLASHVLDRCTSMRQMTFGTLLSPPKLFRAVRARKKGLLAGSQGRGVRPQRQRALWTKAHLGLARSTRAGGSVRVPSRGGAAVDHMAPVGITTHQGGQHTTACGHVYPQVWTGLWTYPSIRRQAPR